MGERVARGHVEKDPRPTADLGRHALQGVDTTAYSTSVEDALYMAYEGFPEVQKSLAETSDTQLPHEADVVVLPAAIETVEERIARTRYVATSTPINGSTRRKTETLTTEAL